MKKYNHKIIEKKWQDRWDESKIYKTEDFSDKPKYYCLIEFPYPSGAGLHVGHLRSHIAIDIVARKKRMSGYNVMYPIGWDAFGLPTENFAIKTKTHPKVVTKNNVKNFTRQIKSYGPSFDWSREINTTDPKYYKWTQWIFLKLFNSFYDEKLDKARPIEELKIPKDLNDLEKREFIDNHRLAYEAEMAINWCPSCKIGLANEEVVNGACERCGAPAEKKTMKQWMLKITKYADRLIKDLDTVDYLDKIKTQQINWIGKSEGAIIKFPVINGKCSNFSINTPPTPSQEGNSSPQAPRNDNSIEVFTTRPDTIFGCTCMVLSPEHPLIKNLEPCLSAGRSGILNSEEVKKYIEKAKNKSDLERTDLAKEKTGVELKGVKAINPANNEEIPIWIADYVLASYGTGSIMAVPAHDERDFEFARKFGLEIKQVVKSEKEKLCLIIHGSKYTDERKHTNYIPENKNDWLLWTKEQLEKRGIKTYTPLMPASWQPNYKKWKEQIENLNLNLNENSILIGHSAGGSFIVRWLGEKQIKINKLILIAPSKLISDENGRLKNLNDFKIDSNIKNLANEIIIFSSKDDKPYRIKSHKIYKSELDARLVEFKDKGHFTFKYMRSNEFPELLEEILGEIYTEDGVAINSGRFNELTTAEFKKQITEWLSMNNLGRKAVNYKLRDWVFSRQHYWGEPIPIVKCEKCGNIALQKKDLPLELPEVKNYEPTDTGESPLAKITKWVNVKCPKCNGDAKRETDTMPNWAGSSWYFLRYLDPKNDQEFASQKNLKYWMPVDLYNGGMEHTTLHLLYSRFWHKFLYDLEYVNTPEPYAKRRSHGMILAEDGQKMSKSRGNVVNPDEVIKQYGADSIRLYEMFMGPYGDAIPWNTTSLVGMNRFLERVWNMQSKVETQTPQPPLSGGLCSSPDKGRLGGVKNTILIATNNEGKLKELKNHLRNFNILSLKNIDKKIIEPIENGKTFEENSLIKAKYYAEKTGYLTIADDSGLCVNALDGRPGVFSSRYAEGDDKKGCEKLIKELGGKTDRSAYFQSVVTLYNPKNEEYSQFDGICEGEMLAEPHGANGFGYDLIFIPKNLKKSFGECSAKEKHKYDHRKKAIDRLIGYLEKTSASAPALNTKNAIQSPATEQLLHKTIKKVTEDIENLKFNTAISSLMIFANEMEKEKEISLIHYSKLLILLSPFAPHITEELWETIGEKESIHLQPWPEYNSELIKEKEIILVIQINGKLRDQIKVSADISEEDAKKLALESEKVKKWIEEKEIRKIIFVKGKLVNVVV